MKTSYRKYTYVRFRPAVIFVAMLLADDSCGCTRYERWRTLRDTCCILEDGVITSYGVITCTYLIRQMKYNHSREVNVSRTEGIYSKFIFDRRPVFANSGEFFFFDNNQSSLRRYINFIVQPQSHITL